MSWVDRMKFDEDGLVPVVVQEESTGQVLMLAYADARALELTRTTGRAWYWSRERRDLWRKGDTSGNTQEVVGIELDCDSDAVLYRVIQTGCACHKGTHSCFHNVVLGDDCAASGDQPVAMRPLGTQPSVPTAGTPVARGVLERLTDVIERRKREMPSDSYVAGLFRKGLPVIARKVGEEASEFVVALLTEGKERAVSECADVLFHSMIALECIGARIDDVLAELAGRERR